MRILVLAMLIVFGVGAAHAQKANVDNNGIHAGTSLGDLTKDVAGREQGLHASDPENDGVGGGDTDPRVGLSNVIERGDLSETINAIDGVEGN